MTDQTGLWQNFLKGITGTLREDPKNVIGAGSGFPCDFGSLDSGIAPAQLYALANTIPPWSLQWNGATNNNLFSIYKQFVNIIYPNAIDPDSEQGKALWAKMQEVNDKIVAFQTDVDKLKKEMYASWLNEVCRDSNTNSDGVPISCKANSYYPSDKYPNGDQPDPTFPAWLQQNKDTREWAEKIQILTSNGANTLLGLQSEYSTLAQQYFGAGYKTIAEAQQVVAWADPEGVAVSKDPPPDDQKKILQMQIKEGSNAVSVPSFSTSPDLEYFRNWLQEQQGRAAKNGGPLFGKNADVQIEFDDTCENKTESGWQFSANVGIPIDWFWLGENASGSHSKQYDEKSTFKGTITYQSVTKVMFQEGQWFDEGLLETYANFDLTNLKSGDPFYGEQLWGPNGKLNILVKGVIIGYAPYLRLVMQDWQNSQAKTNWSTKTTFGIGPFNFESASASGYDYSSFTQEIDNGIEVRDTSGQPKVIALIVETPNY
jgi:hypothetical protein